MQEDVKYYYFLTQKSLDGKYNIYSYWRSGMMAFSGDIYGTQIQKANENFHEGLGIKLNGEVLRYIGKDTIEVYRKQLGKQPSDTIPNIRYEKAYDLTLKVLAYDGNSGRQGRELYFDELILSDNKIVFKGVCREIGADFKEDIEVDLGSVHIETESDTITQISFKTLKASMDGRFKNPNGVFSENLPSVRDVVTRLIPTSKLMAQDFENLNGIFYDGKKILATKPIANRAVSAVFIGLVVFTKSAKSFDLAIGKRKIITKCKSFG